MAAERSPSKRGDSTAAPPAKRKVTLYFNAAILAETQREAIRQDRSISWIIQAAWKMARDEIRQLPTATRLPAADGGAVKADETDATKRAVGE